jgi:NAD-dependent histone deacetylase SIR2
MGQEESRLVDDNEPTETLEERSLSAVASYIKSGKAKNVVVLTGAGISTSAGSECPVSAKLRIQLTQFC